MDAVHWKEAIVLVPNEPDEGEEDPEIPETLDGFAVGLLSSINLQVNPLL